jgi:hypothetical protein
MKRHSQLTNTTPTRSSQRWLTISQTGKTIYSASLPRQGKHTLNRSPVARRLMPISARDLVERMANFLMASRGRHATTFLALLHFAGFAAIGLVV